MERGVVYRRPTRRHARKPWTGAAKHDTQPFFAVFALCRLPSYAARPILRRMVGLAGGNKISLVRQSRGSNLVAWLSLEKRRVIFQLKAAVY
jgi:hypothetical protein